MLAGVLFICLALLVLMFAVIETELDYGPQLWYDKPTVRRSLWLSTMFIRTPRKKNTTMALTDSNLWNATFTFRDKDGNTSSAQSFADGALLYAAASAKFAVDAGLMGALSDAELKSITITRTFNDPDLLVNGAGASSDVERKGAFVFVDSQYKAVTISVPSLKYGLTIEGSNKINRLDPAVLAFVTEVAASGRTYRNLDIIRLVDAEKRHRRSSEG